MAKIKQIKSTEILNAQGHPTIETTVVLSDDTAETASVPSGTSVGSYEAAEVVDRDPHRFGGRGVLTAINTIQQTIAPALLGMEATKQQEIDKKMIELDATLNKSRLGANAMLCVSEAVAKAAAKSSVLPLFLYLRQFIKKESTQLKIPTPMFNLINGGKHAKGTLNFQEFFVIPASSSTFSNSLQMGSTLYFALKNLLDQENLSTLVGDEGGFSPRLTTNQDALLLLQQAVNTTQYRFGFDVFFGIDAAATNFYTPQGYAISDRHMNLSSKDLADYYAELNKTYHLLYLEDPMSENDWEGWNQVHQKIAAETIIAGDDLVATNPYRLQMALDKKVITGVIIKPNQIGTVIETLAVVEVARQAGLKIIVSHRSGETNDSFIADFAVAASADYVKFGAPVRGERVAKYNRLLEIERQVKTL